MRQGHGFDRLPVPVPARLPVRVRGPRVAAGLAILAQTSRSLRRVLACAAADHLQQAAAILRHTPSVDALLLGAAGTAEVIGALDAGAQRFGTILPAELAASTERLRRWATTLKQPHNLAAKPACSDVTDLPCQSATVPPIPDHDRRNGPWDTQPDTAVHGEPINDQVQSHLAEATAALRSASAPLDPALLGVVLRGLADVCWLLHERGHESPAQPTVLFRDYPVVAEALSMWARRVDALTNQQHAHPDTLARP